MIFLNQNVVKNGGIFVEKLILKELQCQLGLREKIILKIFKRYTYKIYIQGLIKGFNWKK